MLLEVMANLTMLRRNTKGNQGKSWMLTDKIPITGWQSLAPKWMINSKANKKEISEINSEKDIQFLYETFLEGKQISKNILAEYFDFLQLPLTE